MSDPKGKGKAVEQPSHDMSMDDDEDSSEEGSGNEEPVRTTSTWLSSVYKVIPAIW
jgi:hypothetical protein